MGERIRYPTTDELAVDVDSAPLWRVVENLCTDASCPVCHGTGNDAA